MKRDIAWWHDYTRVVGVLVLYSRRVRSGRMLTGIFKKSLWWHGVWELFALRELFYKCTPLTELIYTTSGLKEKHHLHENVVHVIQWQPWYRQTTVYYDPTQESHLCLIIMRSELCVQPRLAPVRLSSFITHDECIVPWWCTFQRI